MYVIPVYQTAGVVDRRSHLDSIELAIKGTMCRACQQQETQAMICSRVSKESINSQAKFLDPSCLVWNLLSLGMSHFAQEG